MWPTVDSAEVAVRIKMGEAFQLHNKAVILVCSHCAAEFEYFTEFTLHVQEHLYQLTTQHQAIVLLEDIGKSEEIDNGQQLKNQATHCIAIPEPISIKSTHCVEQRASIKSRDPIALPCGIARVNDGSDVSDGVVEAFDFDATDWNDGSADDEETCEVAAMELSKNTQRTLRASISAVNSASVDFFDSPTSMAGQPLGSTTATSTTATSTWTAATSTTSTTSTRAAAISSARRPKNPPKKRPNPAPTPKTAGHRKYAALIDEYQATVAASDGLRKLNLFRMQLNVLPSDIADTPETRFIANMFISSAAAERVADRCLCPICDKGFKDVHAVRRHALVHARGRFIKCGLCAKAFRQPTGLQCHLKRVHHHPAATFECCLCHKPFETHRFLAQHMDLQHTGHVYCWLCDKQFKRRPAFVAHMNRKHCSNRRIGYQATESRPIDRHCTLFECYACHKEFRGRRQLRVHMRCHSHQPKLCLVCGAKYATATSLYGHMLLHAADGVKSHVCDICGKAFAVRRYLLLHRRKMHQLMADNTVRGQPTCTVCGAVFGRAAELAEHMKAHPYEEKRKFVCPVCKYAAHNARNLQRHMDSHTDARTFECPICNKMYRDSSALNHMRTHNGPRFACKVCGRRFKRPTLLRRHLRLHDGDQGPSHKCDRCDYLGGSKDELARHRCAHDVNQGAVDVLNRCQKGFSLEEPCAVDEAACLKREVKVEALTAAGDN